MGNARCMEKKVSGYFFSPYIPMNAGHHKAIIAITLWCPAFS